MNTRTITLAAAIAASALLLSPPAASTALGLASLRPAAVDPQRADQDHAFSVNGRIESVDYTSNTIVLRTKNGQQITIALTPTTSVEESGQVGSIADLRPGVHVKVRGSVRDGAMVAESIVVK